jgi:Zn finger protein HypA/HybF involved in hydrogenase expression
MLSKPGMFTCWQCGARATTQVDYKGCRRCGGAVCGNPDQTLYTCPDCQARLFSQMARHAFDRGGPRCDSLRGRLGALTRRLLGG